MTHKLIKTDNYLLVVDDSVHPYDSSKVGNPLAHLPLNGSPILEGVDLLPPYSRHQEDGFEELAEYYWKMQYIMALDESTKPYIIEDFKAGYNKAREKFRYTEEDVRKALLIKHDGLDTDYVIEVISSKYPTEFECEMIPCDLIHYTLYDNIEPDFKPKTITTAQGIQWVGKYVF